VRAKLGSQPRRESSTRDDRVRAEQIRVLYRTGPVGVAGAAVATFVLAGLLLYIGKLSPAAAKIWLACVVADVAAHLAVCRAYWRVKPADGDWWPWAKWFIFFSAIEGAIWGAAAFVLNTPGDLSQLLLLTIVASTVASGAVAAFGSYLPAFYALFFLAAVPHWIAYLVRDEPLSYIMSALILVYILAYAALAARLNANFLETIRLRLENLDLIEDLRREKEAAEQANISKSRFLAAASHDLRQPVHALSLCIGALQGHAMPPDMRQLVEQIEGSVDVLDGLFSSLLDISRLDAGVLEARYQPFPIQPLLERVCRDYRQESEGKGVKLDLIPTSAIIDTDPILCERILRNLVSNAVRFTSQGRVVVGCRHKSRLSVEVWDTGCGIAKADQARIFDEFYQVGNIERDRTKGLGLGLAIVKRLTALLDCPLTLASEPGKGSVFKIAVPLAEESRAEERSPEEKLDTGTVPGLILVVDDEAAIQRAFDSLLSGWGHEVIAAGSCAEMLERIASCPARPKLIICDYRLRDGENGIEVIARLQSEYNEDIPAILITGDTAPDRLKEAQASGLLLLHKPVGAGKLRAAIGSLMGGASHGSA
jgi:two-component system, sensor histidine kinase